MKEILVLCPQARDILCIEAADVGKRYRVRYVGSDLDQLGDFEPSEFVAAAEALPADGVIGTKDQSALLASIIAERRGLTGPTPAALIACQHKPTSRALQQEAVPEATPDFAILDGKLPFDFPFFVKPVVGRLSQNAFRIDDASELDDLHEIDRYTARYGEIAALAGASPDLAHGFLAEELLTGLEVTLEGYVHDGRVTTIGVTDSVKYPGTLSFERFEYPTRLSEEKQAELCDVAARILAAAAFDGGFFNVEFFVRDGGQAQVIEVNGRIATQFAPLVHGLHGRSTYDALMDLAAGSDPEWVDRAPEGFGVSYVVRVFEDAFVDGVPEPQDGVELLVRPGLSLSEQGLNDAQSYRLAILYGFGETRDEAVARCRERAAALSFRLAPVPVR